MRQPLAQPITLDFDQVWLIKTERGRALLDVLSSGEISGLLAGKVDSTDNRLGNARSPTIHGASAHDSTVEAVANKNQPSGYPGLDSSGLLDGTQQLYGTAANTACQGNDSRLSDARTPTTHGAAKHDGTVEATSHKGAANGYCGLDANSKINPARVPVPLTLNGATGTDYLSGLNGGLQMFALGDRGGQWGLFRCFGSQATGWRLGECYFSDLGGANPADGGTFNCDWNGSSYEWHFDVIQGGAGARLASFTVAGIQTSYDVQAGGNFICQGLTGYTGPLRDSNSIVIADVTGGIITAVYF